MAEAMIRQWFDALRSGKVKEFEKLVSQSPNSSELLLQTVGSEQNTILHVATRRGHAKMVDAILKINSSSSLLNIKNSRGNTPMHVAAGIGHAGIVSSLIKHARGAAATVLQDMLCAKNEEGNTPLHEAAKRGHKPVVEILLKTSDPTMLDRVLNEDNEDGQTPPSLAVLAKSTSIVEVMLNTEVNFFEPRGPHNHTLLHLTVLKQDLATLKVILGKRAGLTREIDINGRTPLHYAAALGNDSLVQTLLKQDASMACLADHTLLLPIHLAVQYNDNISVVQRFYRSNPSVLEFNDSKCRNVLHVAAEKGNFKTVLYLMKLPEIEELINSADEDGNTPLHLSAQNRRINIVRILSRHSRVDVGAANKDGHKAIDMMNIVHDQTNSSSNNRSTLQTDQQPLRDGMMRQAKTLDDVLKLRSYPRFKLPVDQNQKQYAMVLLMVATIVTTVTYGVIFQVPGGYITGRDPGSHKSIAVLSKDPIFQSFIVFDVTAMLLSLYATLAILWAFWSEDGESFPGLIHGGMVLTSLALVHMAFAFALAANAVLGWGVYGSLLLVPLLMLLPVLLLQVWIDNFGFKKHVEGSVRKLIHLCVFWFVSAFSFSVLLLYTFSVVV